jgi:adenylate cyclase
MRVVVSPDDLEEMSFGPFRLDRQRRRLTRRGTVIPLGGRAVDVLAVLAAAAGELVTKDVLLETVWPGLTVEENNLQVQISNLRKALGDGWVVNLPGRGYRLAVVAAGEISPMDEVASKPSIAVLPFTNLSDDREQEYFADGIVEDIITALARTGWLFVIARNSSFSYKGACPDVRVVGRELGVRYVLEGSIRRAEARVRIACQLIEAATGGHIWADRYEGEIADIFDLQDRISGSVVGAIEPHLRQAEIVRATAKPTASLDAYDFYLRALPQFYRFTREGTQTAMELLRRALALDVNYSRAKALLGWVHVIRISAGWADSDEVSQAIQLAEAVLETDHDDSSTIAMAAQILGYLGPDLAVARMAAERALSLSPNSAQVLLAAGWVYSHAGDATGAIDFFQRGIRLSPRDPAMPVFLAGIGMAYLQAGRDEDAIAAFRRQMLVCPNPVPLRGLITVLIRLGRTDEARIAAAKMLRLWPEFRVSTVQVPFWNADFAQEQRDACRLAGLPE